MKSIVVSSNPEGIGQADSWTGGGDYSKIVFGIIIAVALLGHA